MSNRSTTIFLVVRTGETFSIRKLAHESTAEFDRRALVRVAGKAGLTIGDVYVCWDREPRTLGIASQWLGYYTNPARLPGLYTLVPGRGRARSHAAHYSSGERLAQPLTAGGAL